ncbi:putative WEB family protein At1g65010, chloroplastic [Lycium ferocissimum]|uniref:putative WEB family protein At1g65010, chloroplastic n=1 Tax=Lycium ferocissimum TaxID=112874 RepID=UPI00281685B8|nr:putative WEB family protein At1g65010, chloroplastic [Lycium ferocissimum]
MLRSRSRAGSNDSAKKRHSSIISRTISASKLCRCDALGSQIDSGALVGLERKSPVKHPSQTPTDRLVVMQEQMEKLEKDLRQTREQLGYVEEEKSRAINELSEMKHPAQEANMKASDGISREFYAEVKTLKELLNNKQEESKITDKNIESLKLELEKAKKCELKLLEKDASLGKAFKIRVTDWSSDFRKRVQELEDELENRKLSESKIFDAWLSKTRQFEQIKIELEESKLEMKLANEAEEKNRKALDDLALALKEVASEASEAKKKLRATQLELGQAKKEAGNMKETIKSTKVRYQKLLDEAKKEKEIYRSTAEQLKLEAEESLLAWNGKEMSFITCIKEVQEE